MTDNVPPSRGGYRARIAAAISRYTEADHDELLAFRRSMYPAGSVYHDDAYFRWLYTNPPYRTPGKAPLWIYRKDGSIEGQQAGLPVSLKIGETSHDALWGIDLIVNPKYQVRGVGPVLTETALAETG